MQWWFLHCFHLYWKLLATAERENKFSKISIEEDWPKRRATLTGFMRDMDSTEHRENPWMIGETQRVKKKPQ